MLIHHQSFVYFGWLVGWLVSWLVDLELVGGGIGWNWLGVELVAMVGRLVCLFVGGLLVCFVVVCLLTCLFVCLCVPVCVSCLTDAKSLFR